METAPLPPWCIHEPVFPCIFLTINVLREFHTHQGWVTAVLIVLGDTKVITIASFSHKNVVQPVKLSMTQNHVHCAKLTLNYGMYTTDKVGIN